jgi:ABC-type multidrug transport system fused ATPase/permease subunit
MASGQDIVGDGRLARLWLPIGSASALSALVGVTETLATAGLAAFLTSGIGDLGSSFGGPAWLIDPWVIASLTVLTFLLNLAILVVRERTSNDWEAQRRKDVVDAYAAADLATQRRYSGGQLSVASEQIGAASAAIGNVIGLANNVLRTISYVVGALVASWQVSVIAGVSGGVLVVGLRLVSLRTRVLVRHSAAEAVEIGDAIGDMASSARELQLLAGWENARRAVRARIDRVRSLRLRARSMAGLVGPVFAVGTGFVGLAVGVANRNLAGVDVPALAASGFLLVRALGAAQSSQTMYQQLHDTLPYVERSLELIGALRRQARPEGRTPAGRARALELVGVSLSHGNDEVVHDLTIRFDGVGGVAIVGPSGSGKSTTLQALGGLIEPTSGQVELDGVPLGDLARDYLGAELGLLPQDPQLLRSTLRENLVRSGVEVSDELLWAVIEDVGLLDTVRSFSAGLDTPMGRTGEGFSGGELQRLGLARLIVNQPSIWLLDEPTSALDRANSERVSKLIADALQEHLVVLVTHRPELLAACHRVVVIVDGRLVDDGPVDLVAARQPFLAAMLDHSVEVP